MRLAVLAIAAAMLFIGQAQAITNYQSCLNCFYQNRTNAYFCQQNSQCLPLNSPQCTKAQQIVKNYQCVEGFADCTNVTFVGTSVGTNENTGYGLLPGYGCYIKIDRTEDGSYGTLTI